MMKFKLNRTNEQKQATKIMKEIAEQRYELMKIRYMRELKNEEPGKKIFSEYVEGYVCDGFGLKREKDINNKDFDATDPRTGEKIQIKECTNSFPHITKCKFDKLVVVRLDTKDFSIKEVLGYPKVFVEKNKRKDDYLNINKEEHRDKEFILYKAPEKK